jgi:integrase
LNILTIGFLAMHKKGVKPCYGKEAQDEFRDVVRTLHYSYRTGVTYWAWVHRFILFHNKRHPRDLGAEEISAFLTHLATKGKVASSTQNQALSALLFLYMRVLKIELPWIEDVIRAKNPVRVPVVLTRSEAAKILGLMQGKYCLMAPRID